MYIASMRCTEQNLEFALNFIHLCISAPEPQIILLKKNYKLFFCFVTQVRLIFSTKIFVITRKNVRLLCGHCWNLLRFLDRIRPHLLCHLPAYYKRERRSFQESLLPRTNAVRTLEAWRAKQCLWGKLHSRMGKTQKNK